MRLWVLVGLALSGCQAPPSKVLPEARQESAYPVGSNPHIRSPLPVFPIKRGLTARTPVLTYHDIILRRDKNSEWFDCTEAELRAQIAWMVSNGAHFISLDQLYDHLTTGAELPDHAVAITFADNYLGFYLRGLPVLRKAKIPVTMFVHTGFVGSPVGRPKLNWPQLKQVAGDPLFTIGSETVHHPPDITQFRTAQIRDEMTISRQELIGKLGHPVRFLAYPNGNFNQLCLSEAEVAGYNMAFTEACIPAELSPSIFAVGRYVHTKYKKAWAEAYGGPNR